MKKMARTRLIEARKQRRWSQQNVADLIGTTRHNVSRWEAGLTAPGPYFRAKLCDLFGKSLLELGLVEEFPLPQTPFEKGTQGDGQAQSSTPDISPLWMVPYSRNPHFIGREDLLARLDQQFSPGKSHDPTATRRAALTQPRAIKGLGGIGKTQIAVEYAYRSREKNLYTHTLWINAASEETIMTSMVALAEMLPAFSAGHETDQQKLVDAVKHWLRQCQQLWLLIFDNADDIALLRPYLPQQGKGFLLFTTRSHAVGSLAASIEVENMDLMEGTTFLLQRAQRQHVEEDERNEAMNVVISLDGFPLALDQAGAYVEETGCSFKDYIQLYLEHHRVLLARRGMQVTNYPDSVATTWSLSFQKIAETNLAAVELLHLCAFLAPDEIPEELLTSCAEKWPPLLWQAVANRITFDRLLEDLLRFSLIKRQAEKRQFRIHRLVQVVQQDAMAPEEQRQWAERVICAVHSMFPRDPKADVHSWPQCLRYLEQAQACDTLMQQYELVLPEAAELLDRVGTYLSEHASYTLAESLYQRSLRIWEHQMDQAHPSMTSTLNNLASLYLQQGKYGQAEPLYQRALSLREKQLGANHSLVAQPLNNLAVLYSKQERYAEAEPLFQRALSLREQQVGPDHADLAYPLNGLAELYRRQKRYAEAEPLFQRALSLREKQLGPDHSLVAHPLNNLAEVYKESGRYAEAEPLFQRALRIWEQQLGSEHPLVAYPLNNLAEIYTELGRYTEAEELYQRALAIREGTLGADHLDTSETLRGFAALRLAQGHSEEAAHLYQRVLSIQEQVYGPQHPKAMETSRHLSSVRLILGGTGKVGEEKERAQPETGEKYAKG